MTCPEPIILSQLADGELPPDQAASLGRHLADCPTCGARARAMRRALATGSAAARAAARVPERPTPAAGCLSPNELARWLDPSASPDERRAADEHIARCDTCLEEAIAARRLLARLDATPPLPVPLAIKTRVASLWPVTAEPRSGLSRIVVRLAREGASIVERHLVAPLRELVEVPLPAPATRAGAAASRALRFRLRAPAATIDATVIPSGDGVGLVLVIEGDAGDLLPDQRVFLRRRGRSVYSARTDPEGTVRTPVLERAVYEVACPGIGTSFRLDLRG